MTQTLTKPTNSFRIGRLINKKNRKIYHYTIGQLLGKGGFGSVHAAFDIYTKQKAAVKIINIKGYPTEILTKIQKEFDILQNIDHPNIIRIYETFKNESNYLIFTELIEGHELFEHICYQGPMKQTTAAKIFHQIVNAVKYLHQRGIIHRDIKAQNLMIDREYNAKLIDFGLATIKNKKNSYQDQYCGSPSYIAPQILQRKKYDGEKVDIWCLGVLLYVMLEGSLPFDIKNEGDQRRNQNIRSMNWHYPLFSSPQAKQLYASIFTQSNLRITINQILKSAFFKKHGLSAYMNTQNSEAVKRKQQKALDLTSQVLNISKQAAKLQVEGRYLGKVYAVYNLLLKKENLQDFHLQQLKLKTETKINNSSIFFRKLVDYKKSEIIKKKYKN